MCIHIYFYGVSFHVQIHVTTSTIKTCSLTKQCSSLMIFPYIYMPWKWLNCIVYLWFIIFRILNNQNNIVCVLFIVCQFSILLLTWYVMHTICWITFHFTDYLIIQSLSDIGLFPAFVILEKRSWKFMGQF